MSLSAVDGALYGVGLKVGNDGRLGVKHQPIGDAGAVAGFFADKAAALKVSTTLSALAQNLGAMASLSGDIAYGFDGTAAGRCIKPLSNAGSMTALPKGVIYLCDVGVAISECNIGAAGWSLLKMVNSVAEFLQGLLGAMNESGLSKVAGNVKQFTAVPSDLHGMWKMYDKSLRLRDPGVARELPHIPEYHDAKIAEVDSAMVKNATGFMFHATSFATGFFALVVSPFWGLFLGVGYLVATVVNTVFSVRVTDIREADIATRLVRDHGVRELQL